MDSLIKVIIDHIVDYSKGGIKFDLEGNGGDKCWNYLSSDHRWLETSMGLFAFSMSMLIGIGIMRGPPFPNHDRDSDQSPFRKFLSFSTSLTIGMQFAYKLATRQGIFILNPCHVLSFIQIYLLLAKPNVLSNSVFRITCCLLHGPLVAIIFPVTNTLFLPGELLVFWAEHFFLVFNQIYLLRFTSYTVESKFGDISWGIFTYGVWGVFNFIILQGIGWLTLANLNFMLCPALSDPFVGPNFRLHAMWHQAILTIGFGKICYFIGISQKNKLD